MTLRVPSIAQLRRVLLWGAVSLVLADQACASSPRLDLIEKGNGRNQIILLHGLASKPEEWLPFTVTIQQPQNWQFVFPRAPIELLRTDTGTPGFAWWPLNLEHYSEDPASLAHAHPRGLDDAARAVARLTSSRRFSLRPSEIVLGGFSQGGMVAAHVAFTTNVDLKALVLLSSGPIAIDQWKSTWSRRAGLPVFIAHGTDDRILDYSAARNLALSMSSAGMLVEWFSFAGGHEIPAAVVSELTRFLNAVCQ